MKIIAKNCSLVFQTYSTDPVLDIVLYTFWGDNGNYSTATSAPFNQNYAATDADHKYDISIFSNWAFKNGLSSEITVKIVTWDSNGDFLQRVSAGNLASNGVLDVTNAQLPSGTAKIGFSLQKSTAFSEGDDELLTFVAKN